MSRESDESAPMLLAYATPASEPPLIRRAICALAWGNIVFSGSELIGQLAYVGLVVGSAASSSARIKYTFGPGPEWLGYARTAVIVAVDSVIIIAAIGLIRRAGWVARGLLWASAAMIAIKVLLAVQYQYHFASGQAGTVVQQAYTRLQWLW